MLKSMTGFGRSRLKTSLGFIRVEAKSTNHKYLEISARLPLSLTDLEEAMRRAVGEKIKRGKILLNVMSPDPHAAASRLVLNEAMVREVYRNIVRLRTVLKFPPLGASEEERGTVLREVLRHPDVLVREASAHKESLFAKELLKAVHQALVNLDQSRLEEGRALEKDLRKRLAEMSRALGAVQKRIPKLREDYRKNLEKKMKEYLKDGEIDKERMTLEVAGYVKNSDVSEEVTRLRTHMDAMARSFREGAELGRKLDFIGQEMTRETNTLGAKSSDTVIAENVIRLKAEIEKIREQAQNVE